jgi:hypothetical protein
MECVLEHDGRSISVPFPTWSWVGWVGEIHFVECFGSLISADAGLKFYMINKSGRLEFIEEDKCSNTKRPLEDLETMVTHPLWVPESRKEIKASEIPIYLFSAEIAPTVLAFWTSCAFFDRT